LNWKIKYRGFAVVIEKRKEESLLSKDRDELMPNYTPVNNNVVFQAYLDKSCNDSSQASGIKFAFVQDSTEIPGDGAPVLVTLQPIQTNVGDRVKLDAMVQLNVTTNGDGVLALLDQIIAIRRATLLLGQDTPTQTTVLTVKIRDDALNNPPGGNSYTRLVAFTWVDTPPAGISTYALDTGASTAIRILNRSYSNRSLSATIFPIGNVLADLYHHML
jgi:hypothetical protein